MKKEKRIIPKKNYIILCVIIIITLILCAYCSSWYKTTAEAKMEKGIMSENLMQINIDELDNYILENPHKIIYLSSSLDENIKTFENKIYKYIDDNNLKGSIIYIDTTTIENYKLVNALKKNSIIKNDIDYDVTPNIYVVRDGKINNALYYKKTNLNSKNAVKFIRENDDN